MCFSYFKFSVILLVICSLFIDAANNSDYKEQNYWMTVNNELGWCGNKRYWLIYRTVREFVWRLRGKPWKPPSPYIQWSSQYSRHVTPEHMSKTLPLKPFFFNWYSGGGARVQLRPPGTAATNRPTVPAPGDYDDGEIGGMMIGRGTEVLGEYLSKCRFVQHKSHMLPGCEPGPPRWKASD
jgi:hypothetical protein